MKKCENVISQIIQQQPLPTTNFNQLFKNNWQKRVDTINETMQYFGYTAEYGDTSPYFVQNATELGRIIKQYQKPYTELNKTVCQIFSNTFNINMGHVITTTTPLYDNNSVMYMYNPDISNYTFLQFQTELEKEFGITIQNPNETTKNLDTLKKWCDYIAEFKGIQIPHKHR